MSRTSVKRCLRVCGRKSVAELSNGKQCFRQPIRSLSSGSCFTGSSACRGKFISKPSISHQSWSQVLTRTCSVQIDSKLLDGNEHEVRSGPLFDYLEVTSEEANASTEHPIKFDSRQEKVAERLQHLYEQLKEEVDEVKEQSSHVIIDPTEEESLYTQVG